MTQWTISLAIFAHIILGILATIRVRRSDVYEPQQKTYQIILSWLIPIVGSILVLAMAREVNRPLVRKNEVGNHSSVNELDVWWATSNDRD